MPKYGLNKYGTFKYGRYVLSSGGSGGGGLGPYVRYRIRTIASNGTYSEYLTLCKDKIEFHGSHSRARIRTNNGEWVYSQQQTIQGETIKTRIRSIQQNGEKSEWVYGDKGIIK